MLLMSAAAATELRRVVAVDTEDAVDVVLAHVLGAGSGSDDEITHQFDLVLESDVDEFLRPLPHTTTVRPRVPGML